MMTHLCLSSSDSQTPADLAFLQTLQEIVYQRLDDPSLNIRDLQEAFHLSRTHLHRKVKALTGLSTTRYIRKLRLLRAYHLLLTRSDQIRDIAYEVGFSDPSYFYRSFREMFQVAPGAIRQMPHLAA